MPEGPLPEVAAFQAFERGRIWAFANKDLVQYLTERSLTMSHEERAMPADDMNDRTAA